MSCEVSSNFLEFRIPMCIFAFRFKSPVSKAINYLIASEIEKVANFLTNFELIFNKIEISGLFNDYLNVFNLFTNQCSNKIVSPLTSLFSICILSHYQLRC